MKVTTVLNGKISMVLVPENQMEEEIVKQLNGGKVQLIAQNMNILGNSITGGLLIASDQSEDKKSSQQTVMK